MEETYLIPRSRPPSQFQRPAVVIPLELLEKVRGVVRRRQLWLFLGANDQVDDLQDAPWRALIQLHQCKDGMRRCCRLAQNRKGVIQTDDKVLHTRCLQVLRMICHCAKIFCRDVVAIIEVQFLDWGKDVKECVHNCKRIIGHRTVAAIEGRFYPSIGNFDVNELKRVLRDLEHGGQCSEALRYASCKIHDQSLKSRTLETRSSTASAAYAFELEGRRD